MFLQLWHNQSCMMISGVVQNDLHPLSLSTVHQNGKKSQEDCGIEYIRHYALEFSYPCGILQYCWTFIFGWYPHG